VEFASLILASRSCTPASQAPRRLVLAVVTALLTFSAGAQAADAVPLKSVAEPATELTARYPLETLTTVEISNKALTDVADAKAEVAARDLEQRRVCYTKFFVNHCLDAAKEQRRLALKAIRPVDITANAFLRKDRADERDKALAVQDAQHPAEAAQKAQDQKEKELSNADKVKQGAAKEKEVADNTRKHLGEGDKRVADHNARVLKAQQDDAVKESQKAANIASFEKKAKDSAARQKEVADNKAAKAKDLAAKKAAETGVPVAPVVTPPPVPPAAAPAPAKP
jgi:colicin import membrane protein